MRVLALSNEPLRGADPDIPWALERCRVDGQIDEYEVYSFVPRAREVGPAALSREISGLAGDWSPDVMVFFHTSRVAIEPSAIELMRRSLPGCAWIYREADRFWPIRKPFPREASALVGACDAAFVPCGGFTARALRRAGCPFVSYVPSSVNPDRFPKVWDPQAEHEHDVVLIGNDVRSRRGTFPGSRARRRAVRLLERRYGDRFAVYGDGWDGPCAKGPTAIGEQSQVYARSRVCVGVNHGAAPYQFSNRLPIAMASGIPTVYSMVNGYAQVMPGLTDEDFFGSGRELLGRVDALLVTDADALARVSERNRQIAETLSFARGMRHMLEVAAAIRRTEAAKSVPNPWIGGRAL